MGYVAKQILPFKGVKYTIVLKISDLSQNLCTRSFLTRDVILPINFFSRGLSRDALKHEINEHRRKQKNVYEG